MFLIRRNLLWISKLLKFKERKQSMPKTIGDVILSEKIIPAEPGEFYDYTSEFTIERPVFVLMKCKANKARPVEQLPDLGSEANILFCFDDPDKVSAHSIGETFLGHSNITFDDFHTIRSGKDTEILVGVCQKACSGNSAAIDLREGSIIAIMTAGNKYGMFLVQEMTPESFQIVACHILL